MPTRSITSEYKVDSRIGSHNSIQQSQFFQKPSWESVGFVYKNNQPRTCGRQPTNAINESNPQLFLIEVTIGFTKI